MALMTLAARFPFVSVFTLPFGNALVHGTYYDIYLDIDSHIAPCLSHGISLDRFYDVCLGIRWSWDVHFVGCFYVCHLNSDCSVADYLVLYSKGSL